MRRGVARPRRPVRIVAAAQASDRRLGPRLQPAAATPVAGHGHPGQPVPPARAPPDRRRHWTRRAQRLRAREASPRHAGPDGGGERRWSTPVSDALRHTAAEGAAVEFEARVRPAASSPSAPARNRSGSRGLAGRTLTIWADQRSVHLILDGHVLRTVASRLRPEDLQTGHARRPPRRAATGQRRATPPQRHIPVLAAGVAVEIDRSDQGRPVTIAGRPHRSGSPGRPQGHPAPGRAPDARHRRRRPHRDLALPGPRRPPGQHSRRREPRPHRCRRRRCPLDRFGRNAESTPTAGSWSVVSGSSSVRVTPANSSPSSSRTPTCGSCTTGKKSPSDPARPHTDHPPPHPRQRRRREPHRSMIT